MIVALDAPSPKTVCVAVFQRSQAVHALAAFRSTGIVLRGGTRLAALVPAAFGLLLERRDAGFMRLTQGRDIRPRFSESSRDFF